MQPDGSLTNLKYFVEQAEFGSTVDSEGNLYVADGEVYIFGPDGKRKGMIRVPERPSTLQMGGKDGTRCSSPTEQSVQCKSKMRISGE